MIFDDILVIIIPPANCVCGRVYCFHVVRPSVRPCVRPTVTFCLLNILKSNGSGQIIIITSKDEGPFL